MARESSVDLYDVIRQLPNVNTSLGDRGFTIRGISQFGATLSGGTGYALSVIVDDVPLPSSENNQLGPYGAWDLDRVEVLRGPQSTQQGPNALAGAIVIRSRAPVLDKLEAAIQGGVSSYNGYRASALVNVPLGSIAAIRLSYDRSADDGYVNNSLLGISNYAPDRIETYRAALKIKPTADLDATLEYTRSNNRRGFPYINENLGIDNRAIRADAPSFYLSDTDTAVARIEWRFAPQWTTTSISSYLHAGNYRLVDGDYGPQPGNFTRSRVTDTNWRQEARLGYKSSAIEAVAGVYYTSQDDRFVGSAVIPTAVLVPGFPGSLTAAITSGFRVTNYAGFGEVDYKPFSRLTVTLGGRYDHEERTTLNGNTLTASPALPFPLPGTPFSARATSYGRFLPKAALLYELTPDVSLGATYQRGYRAGGVSISVVSGAGGSFAPEFLDNFEVALRSQFFNHRLTVNANAFYSSYTDQQVSLRGPTPSASDVFTASAGKSRVAGFELSASARPIPPLTLDASLGYADTRFLNFVNAGIDFRGRQFAYAPPWSGSVGTTVKITPHLTFATDYTYHNAAFSDAQNTAALRLKAYTLLNARVAYTGRFRTRLDWNVAVYARNLTNETYLTQRFISSGVAIATLGDPRVAGVEVGVRF